MALTNRNNFYSMRYILLILLGVLLFACNNNSEIENEIKQIPMDVQIIRFDKEFAKATPAELPALKQNFPAFFPVQYKDSVWVEKLTDTLQNQLEEEVFKVFPEEKNLEENLSSLFQHIKYYFPQFSPPVVITATSDVDYRNKVILADSILVLALDNYLGSEHEFYLGIDKYIKKEMKPSQLWQDIAEVYAREYIKPPSNAAFLGQIIYYGKMQYLKDVWFPNSSDADKIGYSEDEIKWSEENELYMWQYFVENELLYSTDQKLGARFINPAPFSKFYLEIDNDTPGMLGRYLGWQIVRSYMKNNDTSVQQLMVTEADEIFNKSKYKPKK